LLASLVRMGVAENTPVEENLFSAPPSHAETAKNLQFLSVPIIGCLPDTLLKMTTYCRSDAHHAAEMSFRYGLPVMIRTIVSP